MVRNGRRGAAIYQAVAFAIAVITLVALGRWSAGEPLLGDFGPAAKSTFTLQLLHAADMGGSGGALENVEDFSGLLEGFRNQYPENTLVVSSGDNFIPGPRFYAAAYSSNDQALGVAGIGRGDIALLNAMGFQASALGNHELDLGTGTFASIIAPAVSNTATYPGAEFPYLASNLIFARDENLAPLVATDARMVPLANGSLAGSVVIAAGGQRVGVVGATTPHLHSIAAGGGIAVAPVDATDVDALAAIVQRSVDQLVGAGIDKIVLLAHLQQIEIERDLAARLEDVDIIVAGGSNAILADEGDRLWPGDRAYGDYPLRLQSASGDPLLLVNTDGDYRYLGRLVVDFDHRGLVILDSIDPHESGAYATDRPAGQTLQFLPNPEVSRIASALKAVLRDRGGNVLGRTGVYLAGRREAVRTEETNLGDLTADANLWQARQVDREVSVSLKNAGGIRGEIGMLVQPPGTIDPDLVEFFAPPGNRQAGTRPGDVSQFHIESALRFNNGLVIVPVTARQLVEILEHTIGFDGVGLVAAGQFPQVSGIRFSFDPNLAPGGRIRSLAVVDISGKVVDRLVELGNLVGDPARAVKLVTLNFLANGGDGYPFPRPAPGRVDLSGEAIQPNAPVPQFPDTNGNMVIDRAVLVSPGLARFANPGTEQDALAEYLGRFFAVTGFGSAETGAAQDLRIQNLAIPGRQDTVFG